jgi:hypothetical protein
LDLRQGLTMQPTLAWNSQSSCFSLLSAGIIGRYHCAWPMSFCHMCKWV